MLARITNGLSFSEVWSIWFDGYEASTNFEPVNELLTKGGMSSMFFTISLVILALGFGGLLFVTGIVPTILYVLEEKLIKVRSVIITTTDTTFGVNVFIEVMYLSIFFIV